jgi:hypothetical protein
MSHSTEDATMETTSHGAAHRGWVVWPVIAIGMLGLAIYDFIRADSLGAIAFLIAGIGAALFTLVSRGGMRETPRAVSMGAVALLVLGIVLYAIGLGGG